MRKMQKQSSTATTVGNYSNDGASVMDKGRTKLNFQFHISHFVRFLNSFPSEKKNNFRVKAVDGSAKKYELRTFCLNRPVRYIVKCGTEGPSPGELTNVIEIQSE